MDKFYIFEGGKTIHLCNENGAKSLCGTPVKTGYKDFEIRLNEDQEIEELWGDGVIQNFKWVKRRYTDYCKRCSNIFIKKTTLTQNPAQHVPCAG